MLLPGLWRVLAGDCEDDKMHNSYMYCLYDLLLISYIFFETFNGRSLFIPWFRFKCWMLEIKFWKSSTGIYQGSHLNLVFQIEGMLSSPMHQLHPSDLQLSSQKLETNSFARSGCINTNGVRNSGLSLYHFASTLVSWFQTCFKHFLFSPWKLGKWSNLTCAFFVEMGWSIQPPTTVVPFCQ